MLFILSWEKQKQKQKISHPEFKVLWNLNFYILSNKFYEIHISANVTRKLTELYLLSYKPFCFKA